MKDEIFFLVCLLNKTCEVLAKEKFSHQASSVNLNYIKKFHILSNFQMSVIKTFARFFDLITEESKRTI